MEEITSQEEEMKDLRQKLYDVEADINKVNFFDHVTLTYLTTCCPCAYDVNIPRTLTRLAMF